MNRQNRIVLFACAFVAAVAVTGVVVLQPRELKVETTVPAIPEVKATSPNSINRQTAQTPKTSLADAPSAVTEASQPSTAEQAEGVLDLTAQNQPDVNPLEGKILFNPDDIAALLEEHGSYAAIYKLADAQQRQDLVAHLVAEGLMRDELGNLLGLETDSGLRAYMIANTDPKGMFDPELDLNDDLTEGLLDEDGFMVDEDLMKLLDQPTQSEIQQQEWLARMDLANLVDSEYALNWIRDGREVYPDDPNVNLLASTLLLNLSKGAADVTPEEANWAADYIATSLGGANRSQYSPDQRIRAYYAMYFGPDGGRSYDFLQSQVPLETDPKARNVLDRLVDKMGKQGTMASAGK